MASSKVLTGARCKVGVYSPATGQTQIVGLFNNVSYGLAFSAQEAYILGKYAPAEIDYTSQDAVHITASGWRVIGHGPHVDGALPVLQDLMDAEYIELAIIDRQLEAAGGDGRIAKFRNVRVTGYSTSISARQQVEITMNFVGILVSDESAENFEHPTAASLPS